MTISLNTNHAAYPYIQKVWPFKEGSGTPAEFLSGTPVTTDAGSFTWTLESTGYGITLTTADKIGIGTDIFSTTPNITILLRRRKTDATQRDSVLFGYAGDSSGTSFRFGVFATADGGSGSTMLTDFGVPNNNTSRLTSTVTLNQTLDTFVFRIQTNEIRAWQNGTEINHTTSGNTISNRSNNGTHAGFGLGFSASSDNQFIDLIAMYTGNDLTDAMCQDLSANPNAIFETGIFDTVTLSEFVNVSINPLRVNLGEDITLSEFATIFPPLIISVVDSLSLAESVSTSAAFLTFTSTFNVYVSYSDLSFIHAFNVIGDSIELEYLTNTFNIRQSLDGYAMYNIFNVQNVIIINQFLANIQKPYGSGSIS